MKKTLLIVALMSSAAAFGAAGQPNAVYNPRTGQIEFWLGGKMIHSQAANLQQGGSHDDDMAGMTRRNELQRKRRAGGLTSAEDAELRELLVKHPVVGF